MQALGEVRRTGKGAGAVACGILIRSPAEYKRRKDEENAEGAKETGSTEFIKIKGKKRFWQRGST